MKAMGTSKSQNQYLNKGFWKKRDNLNEIQVSNTGYTQHMLAGMKVPCRTRSL